MNLEQSSSQTILPRIEKFVRTSKKRESKIEDVEVEDVEVVESLALSNDDIDDLITSARKEIDGVFIADSETELLQVNDWIVMPKPIQKVIGAQGLPCGLITMVIGKKDCIAGNTYISYHTFRGVDCINVKGGTIENLHRRFAENNEGLDFYIQSANDDGLLFRNKVKDVFSQGEKMCYRLTTSSGFELVATKDHKIMMEDGSYRMLEDLAEGDKIAVHNKTRFKYGRKDVSRGRVEWCVKYHPTENLKLVGGIPYHRVKRYRAVLEANLNKMTPSEYRMALNTWSKEEISSLKTLPEGTWIHHIDEDPRNDRLENLEIVEEREHKSHHAKDALKFVIGADEVESVIEEGMRETFDIQVEGSHHNFVADGIVVHNCGKTTFAVEALASAQRDGGIAILLDTENKFSLKRAEQMGLDIRRLIIIQATTIEDAFEKFQAMVNLIKNKVRCIDKKTGEIIPKDEYDKLDSVKKKKYHLDPIYASKKVVCVWDSLGATPSEAEMDDSVKDFSMTAAKVIKGHLRKTVRYIRDTKLAFVIVNQVYTNMNQFGKKTTSYGGSGPEYHSAIILEFVKMGGVRPKAGKAGEDFCGIDTQIECVKNHLSQPFKKIKVAIDFKGFVVDRDPEYAPEEIIKELKGIEDGTESSTEELPKRKKVKKSVAGKSRK